MGLLLAISSLIEVQLNQTVSPAVQTSFTQCCQVGSSKNPETTCTEKVCISSYDISPIVNYTSSDDQKSVDS